MSPRRRLPVLLLAAVAFACAAARPCAALVRLGAASFVDAPARFGPRVTGDGICGSLRAAEPADACAPVRGAPGGSGGMAFVLIARGNCSFEGKVRAAQRAGFDAALVHDDEDKASLYSICRDQRTEPPETDAPSIDYYYYPEDGYCYELTDDQE